MDAYAQVERDAAEMLTLVAGSVLRLREANHALRLALIKTRHELMQAERAAQPGGEET